MSGAAEVMAGVQLAAVEAAEPEIQTRTRPSQGDAANDWLCAWCHNPVASEADRHLHEGESEFSFKNPEGVRFNIITFSRTLGCQQAGTPTLEHTWFPGHAWSFCACDQCHMHLGWFYAGPSNFAGLIRDRLSRASLIRN